MPGEASVADVLADDAFSRAFDEGVSAVGAAEETPPEPAAEPAAEPGVPEEPAVEPTAEPAAEPPAAAAVEQPAKETPAAATPEDIARIVAEAMKAVTPAAPAAEPAALSPEELAAQQVEEAAIADLQENWKTHEVAVNALISRAVKSVTEKLTAQFAEQIAPLQAQIAPVLSVAEAQARKDFDDTLRAAHADAFEIIPEVEAWIAQQPEYLQPAYNHILDHGTAAEIVKFFTDYKTATGKAAAPVEDEAAKAARLAAEAAKADRLAKMEGVSTVRTSVTAEPDPQDFDSAWELGAKRAV